MSVTVHPWTLTLPIISLAKSVAKMRDTARGGVTQSDPREEVGGSGVDDGEREVRVPVFGELVGLEVLQHQLRSLTMPCQGWTVLPTRFSVTSRDPSPGHGWRSHSVDRRR